MRRHATAIALALALASGAVGTARAADPYDIHVILPLTGGGAFVGKGQQRQPRCTRRDVNKAGGIKGRPLHFVYHDDQTSPQVAVQLANDVLAEKPAVILGSSLVAMCAAIAPLMKNGPVDYCLSPGYHPPPAASSSRRAARRSTRWPPSSAITGSRAGPRSPS